MYDLTLDNIEDGYEDEIRATLGVDSVELTNDMINTMTVLGSVEVAIFEIAPTVNDIINIQDNLNLNIAFINLAAYQIWPALQLRLLQVESDNKSVAQRFAKALDFDPAVFLNKGLKHLNKITSIALQVPTDISMLDISAPATDELTGTTL